MRLTVARARSAAERERVFAFRYRLAVDELGLAPVAADRVRKRIVDPLDDESVSYVVTEGSESVRGELRLTFLEEATEPAPLVAAFAMEPALAAFGRPAICVASRFTLDPGLPDGSALPELIALAYEDARDRGVRLAYTDCSPHLVPFYEHLGFRRYTRALREVGRRGMVPLLMPLGDHTRLARIRSPLAPVAGRHAEDAEAHAWFERTYPAFVTRERPVLLPDDVFFDLLAARVASDPLHSVALLHGLQPAESEHLLAQATIIQAEPGDLIVRQGDAGDALFVLLAGVAEVHRAESPDFPMALFGAGDTFGEIAFLTARRRTADVAARTRCEVIVLSGEFLKSFLAREPAIAAKVLLNLARMLAVRLADLTRDAAMLA